ncbi:winged helix-turn-helix transcriptional regulator [Amycolatopsis rubida]|uniref:DNA-binding transcriptional regulator, HxlR family n=1 Tax=Amycolatopsis rubida TaxID=112413 RepID=A0A1I5YZ16_9PSEU|nr:helix-turn-helix domain-containing protein [Amycolatopsis rubida]SFQ49350.1 DNA-binding transcriptional regulator, HxlR family [Amycolatopsis rubida]
MTTTAQTGADPLAACRISPAVDLLFSRWTTPILWTLSQSGPVRFVELERRLGATGKVLTQRLRQLERDGLVERRSYAEVPPRVEYEITELGRSLSPVFAALADWTDKHLPAVEKARDAYAGRLPR